MSYVTLWSPAAIGAAPGPPDPPDTPGVPAGATPLGTGAAPGSGARPSLAALLARLLTLAPHASAEGWDGGTLAWVDGRGLPPRPLARAVLRAAAACGVEGARAGVGAVPVVAAVAARWARALPDAPGNVPSHVGTPARPAACTAVAAGAEADFLAPHPVGVLLGPDTPTAIRRAAAALADAGVATCGALATLTHAAVEVRYGAAGSALWHLARGEDRRTVFRHAARERPSASLAWTDFEVRDPAPLVFAVHGLVTQVCAALAGRGEAARACTLTFALGGGGAAVRRVRSARDTADPATWTRLLRAELERVGQEGGLPDGVVGLALAVEASRGATAPQADLFDRGAATEGPAERAAARVVESGWGLVVAPRAGAHPDPARRHGWEPVDVVEAVRRRARAAQRPGGPAAHPPSPATAAAGVEPPPLGARLVLVRGDAAGTARPPAGAPLVGSPPVRPAPTSAPPRTAAPAHAGPSLTLHRAGRPAAVDATEPAPHAPGAATAVPDASVAAAASATPDAALVIAGDLRVRLLPAPQCVVVTEHGRRGHRAPARYRVRLPEGEQPPRGGQPLITVLTAAGPDRVVTRYAGGPPVARDLWQCLTDAGQLVLLARAHEPERGPDAPPGPRPLTAPTAEATSPAAGGAGAPAEATWCLLGWWD